MLSKVLGLLFLCCSMTLLAQKDYGHQLLDSLCHERYDGRGYVNNGDVRAGDFIIRELRSIGAVPIKGKEFSQNYTLNVNTFPNKTELFIGNNRLIPGSDFMLDPNSGSAVGEFKHIIIDASNFHEVFGNIDLDEKLKSDNYVLVFDFFEDFDKEKLKQIKSSAKQKTGICPVIWLSNDVPIFSVGRTAFSFPFITVLRSKFNIDEVIRMEINNKYIETYDTKNVIACIPGKKKKKYVFFTAHYDHLGRMGSTAFFPGGNDNASGTAMLLSLAKYYKANPPEYTIVFCFFSGEEAGLLGSKYYVENPTVKLSKIQFLLNIDIMGSASKGITLVNATKHEAAFNTMVELNEKGDYLDLVKKRGPTANSDHYFFTEKGVPAFFIYSMGSVTNYHNTGDNAANTTLDKFNEVQALMIDFVSFL